jgi:glycine/D-amino acid oxidase-like deaminating enzyme
MARKYNIIVVGNGLFGSIAATLARAHGHTVTVISADVPNSASKASGCVLAPSWLNSMERSQIDAAMGVLGELYTIHDLEFRTNLFKTFKATRVVPSDVLVPPDIKARVLEVGDGWVTYTTDEARLQPAVKLKGKVLVAAGVWSFDLLADNEGIDRYAMKGLWGASLTVKAQLEVPRIHVYAPYKQAVAFNMDRRHVWMGDGTALTESTWIKEQEQRLRQTAARAAELFGLPTEVGSKPVRATVGVRPYVEGHKSGFFERVTANTWVSTGGAKNGTVLAAWQAYKFIKELP